MNKKNLARVGALIISLFTLINSTFAQGTAFTYQGQLSSGGLPATGSYDLTFALFNNSSTNTGQVGVALTNLGVGVTNGLFTVTLDFGPVFTGNATWLAIGVRTNGAAGFTALNPLQPLTPTPYAMYAPTAGAADSAKSVASSNIVGSISLAQLPGAVVTNSSTGVTLAGAFSGNGQNLTNLILGQSVSTVYGTSALTIAANSGVTVIPGLTQTITVPTNSVIYISTTGGVTTTSGTTTGYSDVDIAITIDGQIVTGSERGVLALNTTGLTGVWQNWSISITPYLPFVSGSTHTIAVVAAGSGYGSTATVSGNSSVVTQGVLTVFILKQ